MKHTRWFPGAHIALLIIFFSPYTVNADQAQADNLKMLILSGNSPVSAGRGFTGVSDYYHDSFFNNAASIGKEVANSYAINYGNLSGRYSYPSFVGILPTRYFKLGMEYSTINYFSSDTIDSHLLRFAIAESLTKDITVGGGLNYYYLNVDGAVSYSSLSLGTIYTPGYYLNFGNGFGVSSMRIGASYVPGAYSGGVEGTGYSSLTHGGLGYSFTFFKSSVLGARFSQEVGMVTDYLQLPFKHGMELEFYDNYLLRMGFIYPDAYGYGDLTVGLGYNINNQNFNGTFDYALVHKEGSNFVHYAGLSFSFSASIQAEGDIRMRLVDSHFSPNNDNRNDVLRIETQEYDNIAEWELDIIDDEGVVVASYNYKTINQGSLVERMLAKETQYQLPEILSWDGRDKDGNVLPDGNYFAQLEIRTNDNKRLLKRSSRFVLDTRMPKLELQLANKTFSPSDGPLLIKHRVSGLSTQEEKWTASIRRKDSNELVRSFEWDFGALPDHLSWDGTNDAGERLADGIYLYQVEGSDQAGNRVSASIDSIVITSGIVAVGVSTDKRYYSSEDEAVFFTADLTQSELVTSYEIVVSYQGEAVAVIGNTGKPAYPRYLLSDDAKEGAYTYTLQLWYVTGDQPISSAKTFYVDKTLPEVEIKLPLDIYQPESKPAIIVECSVNDAVSLDYFVLSLYYQGSLIQKIEKSGTYEGELEFDLAYSKEYLPLTDFTIELEAYDEAGNSAKIEKNGPTIYPSTAKTDPLSYKVSISYVGEEPTAASQKRLKLLAELIEENEELTAVEIYAPTEIQAKKIETLLEKNLAIVEPDYKIIIDSKESRVLVKQADK